MTPDVLLAIIAHPLEGHFAVAGGPEAQGDSAQRILESPREACENARTGPLRRHRSSFRLNDRKSREKNEHEGLTLDQF
jgi:hypothetical protein